MVKHRLAQIRSKAGAGFGGKKLGGNAARQAQQRHGNQQQEALHQHSTVLPGNAHVNHPCHEQVEHHFQQLKQRCQNALRRVPFQVNG